MSEKIKELTKSEEQMMDVFWSQKKPLTSVDIINMKIKDTWNNGLVHNMIRSLLKKGLLKECGMERYSTQYARKLCPAMTREEYAAKLLASKIKGKSSVSGVIAALAREESDEEDIIEKLENIIQQLREEDK